MQIDSKIYVAGHRGMVGSAICRKLKSEGYDHIITRTSSELDLTQQESVSGFFQQEKPDYVFLAAAKVGGIHANNAYRGEFIYKNLMIQSNVIHSAYESGVKKLQFLGSSCIYPKFAEQPIREDSLLSGKLEPTNQPYAIAKIAGIEMCNAYRAQYGSNFISVMPTNLYGPNDNYDLKTSHVLPALIRKFHEAMITEAEEVIVWGDGSPLREFMHVDDLADACLFAMKSYNEPTHLNIGSNEEISIGDLARLIKEIVGYKGRITFDTSYPNGTPRKLMDSQRLTKMGWKPSISLTDGIKEVYKEKFLSQVV